MADTTQVSQSSTTAAGHVYDAAQKIVADKSNDPRLAHEHAARTAAETMAAPAWVTGALGGVLSYAGQAAAVIIDTITKAKVSGQPGIHDLIVAALGDVLQLDLNAADVPVGQGPAGQRAVNAALGDKFLAQIKTMFGAGGTVTGDTAEAAAQAFLGFGMQFSASVGLLGVLGEVFSFGHVKEVSEIGEMLERSLGLGRLTRQVMRPYIRNLVGEPLDRKLRAQYRQDLLGAAELVKAALAGRIPVDEARAFVAQHGLSDQFIDELIQQHTPRLEPAETDLLLALGAAPADSAMNAVYADGLPKDVIDGRLKVLAWKRLQHVREAILSDALSQIRGGFSDASLLDAVIADLGIPSDEAALWHKRLNYQQAAPRRRLSQGEMLFLFENSQVTLDQVQQWAEGEGYSQDDQLNLQLYFELKATASHRSASGTATAAAAHVHDEHVAWVTDTFTGTFGNPPTAAELAHWVTLLDNRQRTKADVKAEMKAGQTGG